MISHRRAQAILGARGVWLRPFGRLLYTMPPYVIGEADLAAVTAGMRSVVADAEERAAAAAA